MGVIIKDVTKQFFPDDDVEDINKEFDLSKFGITVEENLTEAEDEQKSVFTKLAFEDLPDVTDDMVANWD